MTRQNIGVGTAANDGTGDTLRQAGQKINDNFVEIYQKLGGDSNVLSGEISVTSSGIAFEGATTDDFETFLRANDPTQDNFVYIPNVSGELIVDSATQTLANKTLLTSTLTNPRLNDSSSTHQYIITAAELTADRIARLPILIDSDTFVFENVNQTLSNKTLESPTLNTPSIDGRINDGNGAEIIEITSAVNAENHIEVSNAAVGADPEIHTLGTDTNINLHLSGKGTGVVELNKAALTAVEQTTGGAADTTKSYVYGNSAGALAISLADGTIEGEIKVFTNKGAGIATITPTSLGGATSIALDQYESVSLIWDGTDWIITSSYGATIS
jgi:hypothetical protein